MNKVGSPRASIDRTFRLVLDAPQLILPRTVKKKTQRLSPNPITRALQWSEALREGRYSSPSDLARELHCSRARVSQVLRLLRLDPEVIDTLLALGDPLPGRTVNEHALRALVDLSAREQRRQLELMLATAARRPRGSAGSNSRGRQDQLANSQKTAQVRAKRQIQRGLTSINGWISIGGHSLGFDRNF